MHVPFLNAAFDTTPLAPGEWLACVGLASVVLWAGEARKLVIRGAERGRRNRETG